MSKLGRPSDDKNLNVKEKLIDAAIECFSKKDFENVSIRQLAKEAKVNSAMINYYFESKLGLYQEMLNKLMAPMFKEFEILKSLQEGDDPFKIHLETVSEIISSNPNFIKIMKFGMLTKDSPFHHFLMNNFVVHIRNIFFPIILQKIKNGEFRDDLEPRYVLQAMISMMLHPHLMYESSSNVFGVEGQEEFSRKVLFHSYSIFINGCKVQEQK